DVEATRVMGTTDAPPSCTMLLPRIRIFTGAVVSDSITLEDAEFVVVIWMLLPTIFARSAPTNWIHNAFDAEAVDWWWMQFLMIRSVADAFVRQNWMNCLDVTSTTSTASMVKKAAFTEIALTTSSIPACRITFFKPHDAALTSMIESVPLNVMMGRVLR